MRRWFVAALIWTAFALLVMAVGADYSNAAQWLPGFEPEGAAKTPNRTRIQISGTQVYKFEACKPVAGKIDIKESGDVIGKWFAVSQTPGQVEADVQACGTTTQSTVTGVVHFSTGGACNTAEGSMHYFSIRCQGGGRCSFWWGVDNHDSAYSCDDPEPVPPEPQACDGVNCLDLPAENVEVIAQYPDGQNVLNQDNQQLCKWTGELVVVDANRNPPRYRVHLSSNNRNTCQ